MQGSWPLHVAALVGIAVVVAWWTGYAGHAGELRARDRWMLGTLRFALLALVAFLLLRPTLVTPIQELTRGSVAVLVDDSRSMTIADPGGETRADQVERLLEPGGVLGAALEDRFTTRYFRFSDGLAAWDRDHPLMFDGSRTDLGGALEALARKPQVPPLVAVVVVSDGGQDGGRVSGQILGRLRAAGVAVHSVGVGRAHERDVEVANVRIPERVLSGDGASIEIVLTHRGLAGRTLALKVEDGGAIVLERKVVLPADRDWERIAATLRFDEPGPHDLTFRVEEVEGEAVTVNNRLYRTLQVHGERVDVLHVEGEPRFEVKFLRRAVADDEVLRLVSLVRTAENKFYRIGVQNAEELAEGFPSTREALFAYRTLILGSVRAADLSVEQQMLIRDFVSHRGGGLVLLGGNQAYAEGGYQGSVLAGMLPIVLPPADAGYRASVTVRPTATGLDHPALPLASDDELSQRWSTLPPLSVVNPIRMSKPGATTLLEADDGGGGKLVILAFHRYGRGTVATFPVRDSWRWQMHADISLQDQTHERLWSRLLRWLARPATGRLRTRVWPKQATPGQTVTVDAEILDPAFEPLSDARAELVVTTPLGDIIRQPLVRTVQGQGSYQSQFRVEETGRYDLELTFSESEQTSVEQKSVSQDVFVNVSANGREFHDSGFDSSLLTWIAQSTGGRYFPVADVQQLLNVVDDVHELRTTVHRIPLWDAPFFLLVLLALLSLEWFQRRRRGLA